MSPRTRNDVTTRSGPRWKVPASVWPASGARWCIRRVRSSRTRERWRASSPASSNVGPTSRSRLATGGEARVVALGTEVEQWGTIDTADGAEHEIVDPETVLASFGGLVDAYHEERDRPDHDLTSHLSAHLRFGTISPRGDAAHRRRGCRTARVRPSARVARLVRTSLPRTPGSRRPQSEPALRCVPLGRRPRRVRGMESGTHRLPDCRCGHARIMRRQGGCTTVCVSSSRPFSSRTC